MIHNTDGVIETLSGEPLNVFSPDPAMIHLSDIAHGLATTRRFSGQGRGFYTVGEHCVRMSYIVPQGLELEALLHDAAEAYLGDMASPVKHSPKMAACRELEAGLQAAIRVALGMPEKCPRSLKPWDRIMMATEARDLGLSWWNTSEEVTPLPEVIEPWAWQHTEARFLDRYRALIS